MMPRLRTIVSGHFAKTEQSATPWSRCGARPTLWNGAAPAPDARRDRSETMHAPKVFQSQETNQSHSQEEHRGGADAHGDCPDDDRAQRTFN